MARKKTTNRVNPTNAEPLVSDRQWTRDQGFRMWSEAARRVEDSRERMLKSDDIAMGRIKLAPPKHLIRSQGSQIEYLIPTLPIRKKLLLDQINGLIGQRPHVERKRPPKGGPTTESRAEETETALNALLRDLFPWEQSCGRSAKQSEYFVVTLLAEDAWDASPEPDDILTPEEWGKLPKKEQATYRKAEAKDGDRVTDTSYKRPKVVYWRDGAGKGVEDEEYGRRDPKQTKKAYDEALRDHLAQHPPFVIRGYSAFDAVATEDSTGVIGLCVRQLMEPDEILTRGYRCQGLEMGEDGKARVLIPRGADTGLWGEGGKVWLYQFYVWIKGDPCVAYMVGGQETDHVNEDGERIEAVINLREKWGFSRLPIGRYYGQYLESDNPDDRPVPGLEPVGEAIVAMEGLIGSANITAWRRGTGKYVTVPAPNVPPAAYLDAANNLKTIDMDPDKDIVTAFGPISTLAPLETSGDHKWVAGAMDIAIKEASPSPAASGGEGSDSGREAALLHAYAQGANAMPREGLRKAYEDAASYLLEWACCLMRKKQISEIPYYADVDTGVQEGEPSQGKQTIVTRLREDWIGKNYRATAYYLPTPNPVLIEQEVSLYEKGLGTFEDVQQARGKTNVLDVRIDTINELHWRSEAGQMELRAIEAKQRGDLERARKYEAWLAQEAAALEVGPDGNPTEVGPSAAVDPMFQQPGSDGATSAQAMRAGQIGAGRGAEMQDFQLTAGAPQGTGVMAPAGAGTNGTGGF